LGIALSPTKKIRLSPHGNPGPNRYSFLRSTFTGVIITSPVFLDFEGPRELKMGFVIIVDELGASVVLAAAHHA
jgi:hypothetical protein